MSKLFEDKTTVPTLVDPLSYKDIMKAYDSLKKRPSPTYIEPYVSTDTDIAALYQKQKVSDDIIQNLKNRVTNLETEIFTFKIRINTLIDKLHLFNAIPKDTK